MYPCNNFQHFLSLFPLYHILASSLLVISPSLLCSCFFSLPAVSLSLLATSPCLLSTCFLPLPPPSCLFSFPSSALSILVSSPCFLSLCLLSWGSQRWCPVDESGDLQHVGGFCWILLDQVFDVVRINTGSWECGLFLPKHGLVRPSCASGCTLWLYMRNLTDHHGKNMWHLTMMQHCPVKNMYLQVWWFSLQTQEDAILVFV